MNQTKTNSWFRLFPSLTDVTFVLPLLWIFGVLGGAKLLLGDGDTGWHLRAGEWMLANGRVPTTDLFSYTKPDAPWFAWEWLWDVVMAWLHQRWGMAAVVFASILVLCIVSVLVFRLTLRRCPNRIVAFVVTAAAMMASSIHWLARPHLFTLLFTVIFLHVIDRVRGGRPRLIWTLVPLMVLWTNLHGGFIVGLSIIGCCLAGEVAALFTTEAADRAAAVRQIRTYALVLFACVAATFVNPYTWHLHVHIARYLSESYHFQNISEFQSVDFHHPGSRVLELLLFLAIWGAIRRIRSQAYGEALITIGWLHLALVMVRNIPIFAIVSAPVAADALLIGIRKISSHLRSPAAQSLMRNARAAANDFMSADVLPRAYVVSLAAAIWLGAALLHPADARFVSEYDRKVYPAKALEWLTAHGPFDRVYTDDEWGDYLIYTGYPKLRVFVDGRSDFYGPEFGNTYLNIVRNRYDWERALKAHNVDTALVRADSPLASTMKESARWQVIYDDGQAVVLRNRVPGPQTSSIAVNDGNAGARIAGIQRNSSVAPTQLRKGKS